MKTRLLAFVFRLKRMFTPAPAKPARPPDPRVDGDPWLAPLFDALGERYRWGNATEHGVQLLRRTGKERFNPMRAYVKPTEHELLGDYDVRVEKGPRWRRAAPYWMRGSPRP